MKSVKKNGPENKCANPISSNCVDWEGGAVAGVNICPGDSISTVIKKVGVTAASGGVSGGVFPTGHKSAYTGLWVDFSPGIVLSGAWPSGTYAVNNIGYSGTYYVPQYKWTQDGDLLVRGALKVDITSISSTPTGFFIPLVNLSPLNFPTGWTATQRILTTVFADAAGGASVVKVGYCYLVLNFPSGLLSLEIDIIDAGLGLFSVNPVNFSVRFNIA